MKKIVCQFCHCLGEFTKPGSNRRIKSDKYFIGAQTICRNYWNDRCPRVLSELFVIRVEA